jgi:hypothetical protein
MNAITILLSAAVPISAVLLDVHIPLPQGCLLTQALRANLLLQDASRAPPSKEGDSSSPSDGSEGVDLFTRHIPHVTLYLADFDLESEPHPAQDATNSSVVSLNQTKVDDFIKAIESLNLTSGDDSSCSLSFTAETPSTSAADSYFSINTEQFYIINGAYTMLPVKKNACIKHLSDSLLQPLQSFLKSPAEVPEWVYSLPEPERSQKISQVQEYGSPNVLENFEPHVTVGYNENYPPLDGKRHALRRLETECPDGQCLDQKGVCRTIVSCFADPCTNEPGDKCADGAICVSNFCGGCNFICRSHASHAMEDSGAEQSQLRIDAMNKWNDEFQLINNECDGKIKAIAVGRNGLGGTVLAGSNLGYWEFKNDGNDDAERTNANMKDVFDSAEE